MNHLDSADAQLTQSEEQAPVENQEASTETAPEEGTGQEQEKTPELTDLSKLEKFVFKGEEMTPEDFERSLLRQQDYTKKTQALAEERKYFDNLSADLETVKQNPRLAEEFKRTYPEKFHGYLNVLGIQSSEMQQGARDEGHQAQIPSELIGRIEKLEGAITAREKEALDARIDAIEKDLSPKYKHANLPDVYGAAQEFMKREGIDPKTINAEILEPFFKASHDYFTQQFKEWQKEALQSQRDANKKGSDIGRGGGTPGEAPQRMSMKEAEEAMIEHIRQGGQ